MDDETIDLDPRGIEAAYRAAGDWHGNPLERAIAAYLREAFAYRDPTEADVGKFCLMRWKSPGDRDMKREWMHPWEGYSVKPVEIRSLPPAMPRPTEARTEGGDAANSSASDAG